MPDGRLAVTAAALDVRVLTGLVLRQAGPGVGAVASFTGLVRDENAGRRVHHLEYEAYAPLAERALDRIEREVKGEWPGVTLGLHHRTGRLDIGEASVIIVAAAAHRADAFAACRYAIERVKQIVPLWKHEHFEGGEAWIEGATAEPDDPAARQEALRRACT
jgi:molybdopterin synthase catalytic subunit